MLPRISPIKVVVNWNGLLEEQPTMTLISVHVDGETVRREIPLRHFELGGIRFVTAEV